MPHQQPTEFLQSKSSSSSVLVRTESDSDDPGDTASVPFLFTLLHQSVRRFADLVAFDCPPTRDSPTRRTMTYAHLWRAVNALARHALRPRLSGEAIVLVLLPRAAEHLYVAQIGTMIAGAAFCCVDVKVPDDQVKAVLEAAGAELVLTDAAGSQRIERMTLTKTPTIIDVPRWCMRKEKLIATEALDRPLPPAPWMSERSLAYVIFTSGTTGKPKGVMIEHRSVVTLVEGARPLFKQVPGDRCGQSSSPAFDSSIEETWVALSTGATVVVLDHDVVRLGPDLPEWLARERITTLWPTPTLLRSLMCPNPTEALPHLRLIEVGGEMLPLDLAKQWCVGRMLRNSYGPTESTITCFRWHILPTMNEIAIGKPIAGCVAWVLDDKLNEVPHGSLGELCVGGVLLARGYLNDPVTTAKSFVQHPKLGRIYRTGDLVKRDEEGIFQCLGRIDTQVKIRGFRIELEAIEAHMVKMPGVRAAACTVQETGGVKHLIGFVVMWTTEAGSTAEAATTEEIRAAVRAALPEYMVPDAIEVIPELPLTVSGKTDRKRLPIVNVVVANEEERGVFVQARTPTEKLIADAVSTVLGGGSAVSVLDDFFLHQGGNSLLAAQLVSLLRKDPNTAVLTVRDVYTARTIAQMATIVNGELTASEERKPSAATMDFVSAAKAVRRNTLADFGIGKSGAKRVVMQERRPDTAAPYTVFAMQTCVMLLELVFMGVVTFAIVNIALQVLHRGFSSLALVGFAAAATFILPIPSVLLMVTVVRVLKYCLIGRYRPGRYRIWGWFFFRHWVLQHVAHMIPVAVLSGTVFQSYVMRALGSRIGKRVHIAPDAHIEGAWDMIEIGDDVSLNTQSMVNPIEYEAGYMIIGPVLIGSGATLDVRAGVSNYTMVGENAYVAKMSVVGRGARVPAGAKWSGVPAVHVGSAPTPVDLSAEAAALEWSELAHGTWVVTMRLVMSTLPVVLGVAAILLIGAEQAKAIAESGLLFSAALVFLQPMYLIGQALMLRLFGRQTPGTFSRYSRRYVTMAARTHIVDSVSGLLGGSRMLPLWLRLAGAQVGDASEVDMLYDTLPELIDIGPRSFFAAGVYLGCPTVHRGTVMIGPVKLCSQTFVGNYVTIPPNSVVPEGVLLGICTPFEEHMSGQRGKSWFGVPPFELPKREVVQMDASVTYEPSLALRAERWFWELLRFIIPVPAAALTAATLWLYVEALERFSTKTMVLVVQPALLLADVVLMILLGTLVKWLVLGRAQPGMHALWSSWVFRWDFVFVITNNLVSPALTMFGGTLWSGVFLRLLGARIGSRVYFDDDSSPTGDPDMINIEDDAVVTGAVQAHTFEDRVLKISQVHVRRAATVGTKALLLYDADLGTGSVLAPNSVAMKSEMLLPHRFHVGVPSHAACVIEAAQPSNDKSAVALEEGVRKQQRVIVDDGSDSGAF